MRREHGEGSSGRSKADQKRSGADDTTAAVNAMSAYHSQEDLALLDKRDDGTSQVIDDLDSKVSTTRLEARKTLTLHLTRYNVEPVILSNTTTILLSCLKSLASNKSSEEEKAASLLLAVNLVLCCGDDHVELYNEFATGVMQWIDLATTAQAPGSLIADVMRYVSLMYAANDRLLVGDHPFSTVLCAVDHARFHRNPEAYGAMLPALAQCCDVTFRGRLKAMLQVGIGREEMPIVLGSLKAIGILDTRFPDTIPWSEVEGKVQLTDKSLNAPLRELQAFLKSDGLQEGDNAAVEGRSTEDVSRHQRKVPTETISFRDRSLEVCGYERMYQMDCLRSVVGEGILIHLARNSTVRRIFGIADDLVTRMTKAEARLEKEEQQERLAAKEEMLKNREKDRQRKLNERAGEEE